MLVVQDTFYPPSANQIRPPRAENEGASLRIGIVYSEIKMSVSCNLLSQMVECGVEIDRAAVVVAIDVQGQQLMLSPPPEIPGGREHACALGTTDQHPVRS